MHPRFRLLRLLADGRFHSGVELGDALGVGRAAVWKIVQGLGDLGVDVFSVPGKGYRLTQPFDPLDAEQILAALAPGRRARVATVEVHPSVPSTNGVLMEGLGHGLLSGAVCIAEHQSAGRGRRGRHWVSPYGGNLYLSIYWRFDLAPAALGPLSVAVGVAVAGALEELGARGFGLKWPNDVYWAGRKLAGILLEVSGESTGPAHVVVGVGVNAHMPRAVAAAIDQPWVDLETVLGQSVDRNRLAGAVLGHLVRVLERFAGTGFEPLREAWDRLDLTRGRRVAVSTAEGVVEGECRGLDDRGALLVDAGGRLRRFLSGEVSVRPEP
jgi:BirA family biotin operon repressor/biotin-[acetyl-CoA-carboxylase] ligase